MSAPNSNGFCSAGVQNTLSTTSSAPAFLEIADRARRSIISESGFDGVSKNSISVLFLTAFSHSARLVGATKVTSTPKRCMIFPNSEMVVPNRLDEQTT